MPPTVGKFHHFRLPTLDSTVLETFWWFAWENSPICVLREAANQARKEKALPGT